jgi:hypothetical protein
MLQSISYTAGALSVVLGVIYYAINLREQTKNRRITLAHTMLSSINSKEGKHDFVEMINMQWSDLDDFKRKYDHRVNMENFLTRAAWWNVCEFIGWQYRIGLVDMDTILNAEGGVMAQMWYKFKPVIYEFIKIGDYGKRNYRNWEYLAEEIRHAQEREDKKPARLVNAGYPLR